MTRPLAHYLSLLHDNARIEPYARAIRRAVRPGSVVVDLGSGVGTFAVLAALQGARRVFAVEQESAGAFVLELARANGVADRIEWLQGRSTELSVPERADLCIYDDLNLLDLGSTCAETVRDAAKRWLARGGSMIPERIELWAAPAASIPKAIAHKAAPAIGGLDLGPLQQLASQTPWAVRMSSPRPLLARPRAIARWSSLDLGTAPIELSGAFSVVRPGKVRGLVAWTKLKLGPRNSIDAGPGEPPTAQPQVLFPLPEPLRVRAGDRVWFELVQRNVAGHNGDHRLWQWSLRTRSASSSACSASALPLPRPADLDQR